MFRGFQIVTCVFLLVLVNFAGADQGVWYALDGPEYVLTTDDIAIGYDELNTRWVFLADSSENGTVLRKNDSQSGDWKIIDGSRQPIRIRASWDYAKVIFELCPDFRPPTGLFFSNNATVEPELVVWRQRDSELNLNSAVDLEIVQNSVDQDGENVIAFVTRANVEDLNRDKIYKTYDSGQHWEVESDGISADFQIVDLDVFQSDPQYIIAAGYRTIDPYYGITAPILCRSSDEGITWSEILDESLFGDFLWGHVISAAYSNKDIVYAAIYLVYNDDPFAIEIFQIWKTTDAGDNWFLIRSEPFNPNNVILDLVVASKDPATTPDNDTLLACFSSAPGIECSINGGLDWFPRNEGICSTYRIMTVAQDPREFQVLWAGPQGAPFKSTDFGANWIESANTSFREFVESIEVVGSYIYAGSSARQRVFFTDEEFDTQYLVREHLNLAVKELALDPYTENHLWSVASSGEQARGAEVSYTPDATTPCFDWHTKFMVYLVPTSWILYDIAFTYENDHPNVFVCGRSEIPSIGGIKYSSNYGDSWTDIIIPGYSVRSISSNRSSNQRIIAGGIDIGVERRILGQTSFEPINGGLTDIDVDEVVYQAEGTNTGYCGTSIGVFRSTNLDAANANDVRWSSVNEGLTHPDVISITLDPVDESIILVATKDGSDQGHLYISADSARTWLELSENLNGLEVWDIACDDADNSFYYAGTDNGVYKMANPVKSGTLATTQTWGPGTIIVNGDVTVPDNVTLTIEPGTTILVVYDFDKLESGNSTTSSEIIVQGTLLAQGTSTDSILFLASSVQLGTPQPGDWKGIYIDMTADCTLEYCSIGYAENGLESRNNSRVQIQHCNFHDNEFNGVYSYKSYTDIQYSRFEENGLAGIDGNSADIDVYGSRFIDNADYGIRLAGTWTGDSTLIEYDTLSCAYLGGFSQHAISISNIDAVRVYKCKARTYTQAGLYLNNSNALVRNNDFSANTTYGIYADNYSFPKIRQCRIDTLATGVRTNNSRPDLGRATPANEEGNCTFLYCSSYFIYHVYNPATSDPLYAQYNYYGGGAPPRVRFYWSSRNSPIIYIPYSTSAPPPPKLEDETELPLTFELRQNCPNPFNPTTTISFALDTPAYASLAIFNLLGQRITTLVDGFMEGGEHTVMWDGRNTAGEPVSSGIYFYVLQSGDKEIANKMTLLR